MRPFDENEEIGGDNPDGGIENREEKREMRITATVKGIRQSVWRRRKEQR